MAFKIGIYYGVYCHPDRKELQYSCRITDPNTGDVIEEFFATEREAAQFWNTKTKGVKLNNLFGDTGAHFA